MRKCGAEEKVWRSKMAYSSHGIQAMTVPDPLVAVIPCSLPRGIGMWVTSRSSGGPACGALFVCGALEGSPAKGLYSPTPPPPHPLRPSPTLSPLKIRGSNKDMDWPRSSVSTAAEPTPGVEWTRRCLRKAGEPNPLK